MKRRTKIFIGIAVFFVALIVAAGLYVDNIIEEFVNRELKTLVEKHKDNFKIQVGEVKSGFLLKRITFEDVYIKALKPEDGNEALDFELNLNKLVLKLYDYTYVLNDRVLKVKEILLDEPNLIFNLSSDTLKQKSKKRKKFGSKLFDKILVDEITIANGVLNLNKMDSIVKSNIVNISDFNFNVKSVVLNLDSTSGTSNFEYKDFGFDLSGIDFNKVNDHLLKIGELSYQSANEVLMIKNVQFENSSSLVEFKKAVEFKTPWIKLNIFEIKSKIPLTQILDKKIHLELFEIGHVALDLYQDNTLPEKDQAKFSYGKLLDKINFPLTIDTIRLLPSVVNLVLKDKEIKEEETFNLKDLKIDVLYFSSDTVYQKTQPELSINLNSTLWDNVPVDIDLKLAVDSASDRLEGRVSMSDLSYTKIESMIEKRIDINLQSGYVDDFYFDFLLRDGNLQGNLNLDVRDIRVNTKRLILPDKIKDLRASLDGLKLKAAFNRKLGKQGKLIVDTLLLRKPDLSWINIDSGHDIKPEKVKIETSDVLFKTYQINHFNLYNLFVIMYKSIREMRALLSIIEVWI